MPSGRKSLYAEGEGAGKIGFGFCIDRWETLGRRVMKVDIRRLAREFVQEWSERLALLYVHHSSAFEMSGCVHYRTVHMVSLCSQLAGAHRKGIQIGLLSAHHDPFIEFLDEV